MYFRRGSDSGEDASARHYGAMELWKGVACVFRYQASKGNKRPAFGFSINLYFYILLRLMKLFCTMSVSPVSPVTQEPAQDSDPCLWLAAAVCNNRRSTNGNGWQEKK